MAIAYDAASQGATNGTSLNVSHTCTGANRVLYVAVDTWDGVGVPIIPTVTYDSVSMTQLSTMIYGSGTDQRLTLFRLVAPSTGTDNITVSTSGTSDIVVAAVSLTGVDQSDPDDTPGQASSPSNTSVSQSVSSATDDLVIDCVAWYNQTITVGSGQTARVTNDQGATYDSVAMSTEPGASTVTMSWSWTTGEWAAQIAVNVNAAADDKLLDVTVTGTSTDTMQLVQTNQLAGSL